jgi:membrane-associated phospholipid phosphatase
MNSGGFKILTLAVALVLSAQLGGFFERVNNYLNGAIPLIDNPTIRALTFLGDDPVLLAVIGTALIFDVKKYGKPSWPAAAFLLSAVLGLIIVGLMKCSLSVPRPRALPGAGTFSAGAFPSGHTFRAALIASYVSDRWKHTMIIAWGFALLVGLTRLLLHYHWFSDVLFSLLFAPWLYSLTKASIGGKLNELVR